MLQVVCTKFGGPDVLEIEEVATPEPQAGEVRIRVTSIGMNHADLMARRGEYKISSGDPPFVPGIEAGGIIEEVGSGVSGLKTGQRVILGVDAPRRAAGGMGGTYRSHYIADAKHVIPAPDTIPDEQLGAIWLTYLTAWGCLVYKQNLQRDQIVGIPAASSGVGLAAAQIARSRNAISIGMTTSQNKADTLREIQEADFDHIIVSHRPDHTMLPWNRDIKRLTASHGVDVFFDPVAAGEYLDMEIRSLAQFGTIWIYGLLGEPGTVDVTPLIRKFASIRGWLLSELSLAGEEVLNRGYDEVLSGFSSGNYRQHVAKAYKLTAVREAHAEMEAGRHIGKLVLTP
jgi:NADPH:quinone reductase-like Zn-dependent oxidoreductase